MVDNDQDKKQEDEEILGIHELIKKGILYEQEHSQEEPKDKPKTKPLKDRFFQDELGIKPKKE